MARARRQAKTVQCLSQLRQVGVAMLAYAQGPGGGFLFPTDAGGYNQGVPLDKQWYVHVFNVRAPRDPADPGPWSWIPEVLRCPEDVLEPGGGVAHSYILNDHLNSRKIKYSSKLPFNEPPSSVVVVGEKLSAMTDWYVQVFPPGDASDFGYGYGSQPDIPPRVERYRHGLRVGSNYLFLDGHAETSLPWEPKRPTLQIDPWDPGVLKAEDLKAPF